MRYWDTSARVPLFASESTSARARRWFAEDDEVVTWVWTRTEITSAIERCARQGLLGWEQRRAALEALNELAGEWDEITEVLAVRSRATALLARHPLRAADAGQLGAALVAQDQLTGDLALVALDANLAAAAEREGLRVLDATTCTGGGPGGPLTAGALPAGFRPARADRPDSEARESSGRRS